MKKNGMIWKIELNRRGREGSQRLLDQGNRNRTHVEEDWLRDSENWVRNSEGRNYGCPECGAGFSHRRQFVYI